VEGSYCTRGRWTGEIAGKGERPQVEESDPLRQQVEESDRRWRGAKAGGGDIGERSKVEGRNCRWRKAMADAGERSQVERSDAQRLHELFFFSCNFPLFATDFQVFATPPSTFATPPYAFTTSLCSLMADNLI
jgi:hypothetical protein